MNQKLPSETLQNPLEPLNSTSSFMFLLLLQSRLSSGFQTPFSDRLWDVFAAVSKTVKKSVLFKTIYTNYIFYIHFLWINFLFLKLNVRFIYQNEIIIFSIIFPHIPQGANNYGSIFIDFIILYYLILLYYISPTLQCWCETQKKASVSASDSGLIFWDMFQKHWINRST